MLDQRNIHHHRLNDPHPCMSDKRLQKRKKKRNEKQIKSKADVTLSEEKRGPIRGFRDTGYSRKKLPGYGIFEEKVIEIQDIEN